MIRWVPRCCTANVRHGFVYVTRFNRDHYAIAWEQTIVDLFGIMHTMETTHCPACSCLVKGLAVARLEVDASRLPPGAKR